jgi:hypothetical protein
MTSEPTLPPIANRLAPLGFLVRIDLSWPYGSSTIKNPPSAVTATTVGLLSWVLAAGPSSPLAPNTASLGQTTSRVRHTEFRPPGHPTGYYPGFR